MMRSFDVDVIDELTELVRYTRLENVPSIAAFPDPQALDNAAIAAMLGWETRRLETVRGALLAAVSSAAEELLDDSRFERAARMLPFAPGDVVLAIGDSITSDAVSWAEILAAVLTRIRPGEIRFLNAAVSGDTSADLIARFHTIAGHRPNWLLVMIGTNDARRHGPNGIARMASLSETHRNLRALATLVEQQAGARLVLITPPPISERHLHQHERLAQQHITWRATDLVDVAELMRREGPMVVDIHQALSRDGATAPLTVDGVHPTLAGQRQIAHTIVIELADAAVDPFHRACHDLPR